MLHKNKHFLPDCKRLSAVMLYVHEIQIIPLALHEYFSIALLLCYA